MREVSSLAGLGRLLTDYTALPYTWIVKVTRTSRYASRVAKLLPPGEQLAMELHIVQNPEAHPIIPGTGGIRKARWGRLGQGKRGGMRGDLLLCIGGRLALPAGCLREESEV